MNDDMLYVFTLDINYENLTSILINMHGSMVAVFYYFAYYKWMYVILFDSITTNNSSAVNNRKYLSSKIKH